MFAMLSAFLPEDEGHDLRRVAGDVVFRSTDSDGNTYKNGLLHSYDDMPAFVNGTRHKWYKDGVLHREGDLPALVDTYSTEWWVNGQRHREDGPALVYYYNTTIYTEMWLNDVRQ
jgi:hypothetical protein